MTDVDTSSTRITLPAATISGSAGLNTKLCSNLALDKLQEGAGPDFRLSSMTINVGGSSIDPSAMLEIITQMDRKTRSVLFAQVEARAVDEVVFSARGLFVRTE